jgi:ribosomal protein L40E
VPSLLKSPISSLRRRRSVNCKSSETTAAASAIAAMTSVALNGVPSLWAVRGSRAPSRDAEGAPCARALHQLAGVRGRGHLPASARVASRSARACALNTVRKRNGRSFLEAPVRTKRVRGPSLRATVQRSRAWTVVQSRGVPRQLSREERAGLRRLLEAATRSGVRQPDERPGHFGICSNCGAPWDWRTIGCRNCDARHYWRRKASRGQRLDVK